MSGIEFIDPLKIKSHLPFITFSDDTSGLIEWFIKMRTKGAYNHVMVLRGGEFVSQGNTYSAVDPARYMKPRNRLLFIGIKNVPDAFYETMLASIERKLDLPKHKKAYDWLGIAGQAIGLKWFNDATLQYCSEDVAGHMRKAADRADTIELYKILHKMPKHAHPQELLDYLLKHEDYFYVAGYWDGVIAGKGGHE